MKPYEYKPSDFLFQPIQIRTYKLEGYGLDWVGVGQFKDFRQFREGSNDLHGVGIQVTKRGIISEGYWENGKLNGQGRHIFSEGYCYIGGFKDNLFDGHGTFYWKYGRKYVGQLKENKRFGKGIQYNEDGTIEREGDWEDEMTILCV